MAKAQVGDLIRVVDAKYTFKSYSNGDIFEVIESEQSSVLVNAYWKGDEEIEENRISIIDDEYEIHRKAGEEDSVVPAKATLHSREKVLPRHEAEAMQDVVNHPNHYTQGRFETIEIIEEITQGYSDGYIAYCVGNALKYLARAPFKHGEPTEDISKAAKYLEFALGRLQTQK